MNYANLIQNITENIKTNGSQAITAQVLQDVLVDMVGELGQSGALLGGVIDTSFVPDSTNDAQVVYIAESPGTYTNFNGLVVGAGEVAFFYFDGNAWVKSSVDVLEVVNSLNSTATDKALSAAMGKQLQDSLTQAVNDLTTAIGNKADRQTTEQALNTLQNQINDKADTSYVNSQLATKADTASVNAALALKADTSAVNAALATKADTSALAAKADKVVGAVAGNMAELDADGNLVDSGIPADNVAEQDGYYETMVVGGAENLIGNDIVSSQFTRRKTGGTADVGTGVAILKTIKGNTLVWNQLFIRTLTAATTTPNEITYEILSNQHIKLTGTATALNTDTIYSGDIIPLSEIRARQGHKVAIITTYTGTLPNNSYPRIYLGSGVYLFTGLNQIYTVPTGTFAVAQLCMRVVAGTYNNDLALNFVDFTQKFGAGNEPASVADFVKDYPRGIYAQDNGSLLNLTATGLQTNGFNQWDEEWESGNFNSTTGANVPSTTTRRSKNYIPVFGGQAYYFYSEHLVGVSGNQFIVGAWDAEKNYIGLLGQNWQNTVQTLPANCAYVRFYGLNATFDKHICINLSDVNKNGTYEPYWTETKALPITTMTGKVNGEGESVVVAPDGMKKAGNVCDETDGVKYWNRIGVVDLGTLTWTRLQYGSIYAFITELVPMKRVIPNPNLACSLYTVYNSTTLSDLPDKTMVGNGYSSTTAALVIRNDSYTTAAAFKAAMNGVLCYYELATPIEYVNDTPLNLQYRVDNDGTETILPENTSTPTTSPIVADINYALNAIDTIRNLPQNYISKASMDAILTAFKTAGVITNYTLTWDATNQKYNCSITV